MNSLHPNVRALIFATIGGAAGYFIFAWLIKYGFYGLAIPGGLLGIGAASVKTKSIPLAIICGLAALALGLFIEWRFFPFVDDDSLGYFLTHIYQLRPVTLIMIAVGAAIGFYGPFSHWLKQRPKKT
jgi:hypothetical protein